MISFMNFFSCLRMPVEINSWGAAIELFWDVAMSLSIFYLAKWFMCILYSILLIIIIILFLLFRVHFYDKDLGLMPFLSVHVDPISIKGSFFSKLFNKCHTIPHVRMFFVVVIVRCWGQYGKYFRVSHILQLISRAFRRVK